MLTKSGIVTVAAGLLLALFTGIAKFMAAEFSFMGLTLSRLLGEEITDSIIGFTDISVIQDLLQYLVVELPFSFFLIGLGILLLIISLFFKNY